MTRMERADSIIAVDVGNSRIKLGRFDGVVTRDELPRPTETFDLESVSGDTNDFTAAAQWCHDQNASAIWLASVNRPAAQRLRESLAKINAPMHELTHANLPLEVRLDEPERVGMDRLLGAVAANALRRSDHAAIIVSVGTAITVNLVGADGASLGGA